MNHFREAVCHFANMYVCQLSVKHQVMYVPKTQKVHIYIICYSISVLLLHLEHCLFRKMFLVHAMNIS